LPPGGVRTWDLLQVVSDEALAKLLDGAGLRQIPRAEFLLELSLGQVV